MTVVVVVPEILVMNVLVKMDFSKWIQIKYVLIVMINVYLVTNSQSVQNVSGLTEILTMTATVYPISTKKMVNVYLGKTVLLLVLNVIAMENVLNVLTII